MQKNIVTGMLLLCLALTLVITHGEGSRIASRGGASSTAPPPTSLPSGAPPPGGNEAAKLAPDFTLTSVSGEKIRLADLLKKGPVLLCFYKLECGTSSMALPKYETFQKAYASGGKFSIVGIVQNPTAQVASSLATRGLTFPHAEDPGYAVSRQYGIRNTPTLVLVDTDRRVLATEAGWNRDRANAISHIIATELGAKYRAISLQGDGLPEQRPG